VKLLIVTYSYSPDLTPRAFRWSAVAAQLARRGHQVDVLCSGVSKVGLSDESDNVVRVFRVKDWLLNASARVAPGAGNTQPAMGANGRSSMRSLVRKTVRAVWRALYWPDYACGWVIPAIRVARQMCVKNDYDWIISVSHPFSGHVIGLAAKRCSPRSRWFADISDPYSDMREPFPNNFAIYSKLNRGVEGRVMIGADAISVTTESTKVLYESSFPVSSRKIYVIPPLLSLPELDQTFPWQVDGTVRLVFVGTLYKKLRSPKFLLACIVALSRTFPAQRFEMHFYGSVNDCGDDFLMVPDMPNFRVLIHGLVSRRKVAQSMICADVLVNIGNDSEAQLASKVIEYMAVGKPILNVVSIAQDASISALADYPSTLTVFRSGSQPSFDVIKALGDFILNPRPVDVHIIDLIRSQFSEDHVVGIYASILEQHIPAPS
jgi:glycosyltransferase involved in cell wall biosynthesis